MEKKVHCPSDVTVDIHEYKAVVVCSCNDRIVAYDHSAEKAASRVKRAVNAHLVGVGSGHMVMS
jgi:hypothetical protein